MTDHIKEYWTSQGEKHGASHWASWGDNWAISLEIETIAQQISDGDTVLDIGCANGYSTLQQARKHKVTKIIGVDFAEPMIRAATQEKMKLAEHEHIEFHVGDIRSLPFDDKMFDVVYTTRVLINLPTWEEQQRGILECLRLVKPGGRVVLSEGFWEPLMLLNSLRALVHLPSLFEHDFNRYLKFEKMRSFLNSLEVTYEVIDFSSVYYLGSRFVRELVTDVNAYEGFSNPINKIFYEIEKNYSGGGMGVQQAVVIHI